MDQAASVTALPDSALYISFFPTFAAEPVPLPIRRTARPAVWVCANSLVTSEKVLGAFQLRFHGSSLRADWDAGAKTRYNLRVVETLVAARVLARVLGLAPLLAGANKKFTLREVLAAYLSSNEVKGAAEPALSPEQLTEGLEKLLGEVEKLRPRNLAAWKAGSEGVVEEEAGEQLGLTMEEMVAYSGLGAEAFTEVYLSWVEGAFTLSL